MRHSVLRAVLLGHLGFCPKASNMMRDYIKGSKNIIRSKRSEANALEKLGHWPLECFLCISAICGVSPLKVKPLWVKSELLTIVS